MTKKSSKSKMTDQTALSYGFGKTTLAKSLSRPAVKGRIHPYRRQQRETSNRSSVAFPDAHLMRNGKEDATASYSEERLHVALDVNLPNYASAIVTTDEIVGTLASLSGASLVDEFHSCD
jgi:hypothetical protein